MEKAPESARRQWILIGVLVFLIFGGAAGGLVLLLRHERPAPRPVVQFAAEDDVRLRGLLDGGQYDQVVAEADRLTEVVGQHATVLRYRALGQLMLGREAEAVATANEALAAGASGPEAAVVNAVKALAALKDTSQQAGTAKEAAQQAMVQAARDPQAGLLANVAFAAVLRKELEQQTRRQGEEETGSKLDGGLAAETSLAKNNGKLTAENAEIAERRQRNNNSSNNGNGGNPQISQITQISNNNNNNNNGNDSGRRLTQMNADNNNSNSNNSNDNDSRRLTQIDADNNNGSNDNKGPASTALGTNAAEAGTHTPIVTSNRSGDSMAANNAAMAPGTAMAPRGAPTQVARIRQALEPIYAINSTGPKEAWLGRIWRLGLAMYGECAAYAGQAGDAFGEGQVLAVLQRCCPADVWACDLKIPPRAVRAAQQVQGIGKVDDHARAALYTAAAVLYESVGEMEHADSAYGRAMEAWQRALAATEAWHGEKTQVADGGQARVVGVEYFEYRHCLERIAVRRANRWCEWIASGRATRQAALAACGQPLFVALVRLRMDRQVDCGRILRESGVETLYWPVVADVIERWPAGVDAGWAKSRADAVRAAAVQPEVAVSPIQPVGADSPIIETQGELAAPQALPERPYAGMTDIAAGVGGGRSLSKAAPTEQQKAQAAATSQPVPEFGDRTAYRPPTREQQAAAAAPKVDAARQGDATAASSQMGGPAAARAQQLSKEIHAQRAAGDLEKALDAYSELAKMAAEDPQTSELTRSLIDMFGQGLEGLGEVQDILDELEGKPKRQAQQRQQRPRMEPDKRQQQRQRQPQMDADGR